MPDPGRSIALAALAFVLVYNERLLDLFRPPPATFCEERTVPLRDIPVSGRFALNVEATQSIVPAEVVGGGLATWLVRKAGSSQPLTTNRLVLAGRVENGIVRFDGAPSSFVIRTIARPDVLLRRGKRIAIGSRMVADAKPVDATHAVVSVRVTCSRFPTTFVRSGAEVVHLRASPLPHVINACESWR